MLNGVDKMPDKKGLFLIQNDKTDLGQSIESLKMEIRKAVITVAIVQYLAIVGTFWAMIIYFK